jgi:hypothetical protein
MNAVSLPFRLKPAEFAVAYKQLPKALRTENAKRALAKYRRGEVWFGPCFAPGRSLLETLPVDVLWYVMGWRLGQLMCLSKTLRGALCERVRRQRELDHVTVNEVTAALANVLESWQETMDEVMPVLRMTLATHGARCEAECRSMELLLVPLARDRRVRALVTWVNVEHTRRPGWVAAPMGGVMSMPVSFERMAWLVLDCVCGGRDEALLADGSTPVLNLEALMCALTKRGLPTSTVMSRTLDYTRRLAATLSDVPWTSTEEVMRDFPRSLPLRADATQEQLLLAQGQLGTLLGALAEQRWFSDAVAARARRVLGLRSDGRCFEHLEWLRGRFCALVLDHPHFKYEGIANLWREEPGDA